MSLPLVALTGDEVAFALLRSGFVLRARDEEAMHLEKGLRHVAVPATATMPPDTLLALLREAGVSYVELIETLDAARATESTEHESHVRARARRAAHPVARRQAR